MEQQEWTTGKDGCRSQFLRSTPSSLGEDCILRGVLEGIHQAKSSIHMCFGHSNFPEPVCQALKEASTRGVEVQIMVNSPHSCDLRGGQRDLFLSLKHLMKLAPNVKVFSTDMKEQNGQQIKPPFIHAKYVTIDGKWSAIGSWNMWHRAVFYEMEHELFIPDCGEIAQGLVKKFEEDKGRHCTLLAHADACDRFLPSGCVLCRGYGPFYN
jgi:phosphatidylserine/phosphatidylglycerophosphate/cardiolipin synthase-like enzyme